VPNVNDDSPGGCSSSPSSAGPNWALILKIADEMWIMRWCPRGLRSGWLRTGNIGNGAQQADVEARTKIIHRSVGSPWDPQTAT
jgi:hypothetical protein